MLTGASAGTAFQEMVLHWLQVIVLEDSEMTQTDIVTLAASREEIEFS